MVNRRLNEWTLHPRFALAVLGVWSALSLSGAVRVYSKPHEIRNHPDQVRRSVLPPDAEALGNRVLFLGIRKLSPDVPFEKHVETLDRWSKPGAYGEFLGPFWDFINHKDFASLVDEIGRRGFWVGDMWGFCPGSADSGGWPQWSLPTEKGQILCEKLGERWLGAQNGEQDNRWGHIFAPYEATHSADRLGCHRSFQRFVERMDFLQGNRMTGLVGLGLGHYFLQENCYTFLGAETAQELPNAQYFYAFIRGAGKQYGVPWVGNVSIFNKWGYKSYPNEDLTDPNPNDDQGPTKGTSLSLIKRLTYLELFYGALIMNYEGRGSFPSGSRTPIAEIHDAAAAWMEKYGSPGVMHTPVALMVDYHAGWMPGRTRCSGQKVYRVWGDRPYNEGDFLTDGIMDMLYPGYTDSGSFRDERGFIASTPYGDIADGILSDAPGWLLRRYPVLVLAGKLEPSAELSDTLADYVAQGGHLVLTEGNARGLFAGGLPKAGQGGNVTLIPSAWGIEETPRHALPETRSAWLTETSFRESPFPLTSETRSILNDVFQSQQLFRKKCGTNGLSFVTCRRGKGDYTIMIANNTWEQRPLSFQSAAGKVVKITELTTTDKVTKKPGYKPETLEDRDLGEDTATTIAGGSVRLFRVQTDDANVVEIAAETPPANPTGRILYLRSNETVKDEILRRPGFFRHWDGVMVDWRYVFTRDDEALKEERNWIDLQGLKILVDFRSGLNLFPDYRFTGAHAAEEARSRTAFDKLLRKCTILGAKTVVIRRHRAAMEGSRVAEANAKFMDGLRYFCDKAGACGVTVRICRDWDNHCDAQDLVQKIGMEHVKIADSLAAHVRKYPNSPIGSLSSEAGDFWFLGMAGRDLLSNVVNPYAYDRLPLASDPDGVSGAGVARILGARQGVTLVFDAEYVDRDAEWRDVKLFEK